MPAVLALACLGNSGARADDGPASVYSLVTAGVLDVKEVGPPPCSPDLICIDWIYRFRIAAETRAGRTVPSVLTIELEVHEPPPKGVHLLLLVRQGRGRGRWIGRVVGAQRPGEEICVDSALLDEASLTAPRGAHRKQGRLCFVM